MHYLPIYIFWQWCFMVCTSLSSFKPLCRLIAILLFPYAVSQGVSRSPVDPALTHSKSNNLLGRMLLLNVISLPVFSRDILPQALARKLAVSIIETALLSHFYLNSF